MPHYFSREEAEALLPQISVVLHKIQDIRKAVLQSQADFEQLRVQVRSNGHNLSERMMTIQQGLEQQAQTYRTLIEQVVAFGCVLKDPDTGLIDFLTLRNGREVYLCWYLGEERINYWHDLDIGFAGRQPL